MAPFFAKYKKDILAVLLLLVGTAVFYSLTYDRSQYNWITRAHEGLSLVAAVRVNQGEIPQRDFTYSYGPLMPYVFAAAFKVFGSSLAVLRATWAILFGLSGVLFYLTGRRFLPVFPAFAAAAMVIGQQHTPLYTYNHIGLVIAVQIMFLALLNLVEGPSRAWSIAFNTAFLVALLTKFNEGIVVFLGLLLAIWCYQLLRRRGSGTELPEHQSSVASLALQGLIPIALFALVTFALNAGLSRSQFFRNFPVLPEYQASVGGYSYVWSMLRTPFRIHWTVTRWYTLWYENYLFPVLVSFIVGISGIVFAGMVVFSKKFRQTLGNIALPSLLLIVTAVAMYHEFYLTGNHWSTQMYIGFPLLALVFIAWKTLAGFPKTALAIISGLLLICVTSDVLYTVVARQQFSQTYIDSAGMHIYSSNGSDGPVVAEVVDFLQHSMPREGTVAAFPHDALPVHLAGMKNALRDDSYQWMLFPTDESDSELVSEIQAKNVSRVLISNFIGVRRGKIVVFGKDYLPQTFKYLQGHYHKVRAFGIQGSSYKVDYFEVNSTPAQSQATTSQVPVGR